MRIRLLSFVVVVASSALLDGSAVFAQQMGGGLPGGGFGGGSGFGGGGFGGGQGGGGAGLNQSMLNNQMNQSITGVPPILGRASQGTFGTRTLGSPSRQRFRSVMTRSQGGGGVGTQYANSGAFSQTRRGTLPGTGMLTNNLMGGNVQQQRGGQQLGQVNPNQQQANRRSNAAPVTQKVTVSVGFEVAGPAPQRVTAGLQRRLSRAVTWGSTSASLEGRTAVLRGSVATVHDRDLAERLALLEPGIDEVRNELTTSPTRAAPRRGQPPAGSTLPPPTGSTLPGSTLPPVEASDSGPVLP